MPKRAGAGRPPGTDGHRAQVTRSIGERWMAQGHKTPLEVLLLTMEHYDKIADVLVRKAGKWVTPAKTNEEYAERLRLVASVKHNRMRAKECADSAAPYMHPKLQAIDIGQRDAKPWHIIMSPGDENL